MSRLEFRIPSPQDIRYEHFEETTSSRSCLEGIRHADQLSRFFDTLATDEDLKAKALAEWESDVGAPALARLASQEYQQELVQTLDRISSPLPGSRTCLMENPSLPQLILIHELFGGEIEEFIASWDIRRVAPSFDFAVDGKALFSNINTHTSSSGLLGSVQVDTLFALARDKGLVTRSCTIYALRKGKEGDDLEKTCYLDHLSVPPVSEAYNLATHTLLAQKDALQSAGFRDMRLLANIEVGGYFWATLGLGWNHEELSEEKIRAVLDVAQAKMQEAVASCTQVSEETITSKMHEALLEWHTTFSQETLPSPRDVARVGRKGPYFARSPDPDDKTKVSWTVCRSKKEAEDLTERHMGYRQSYHLGKIGLLFNDWEGILELDDSGMQRGENLVQFEEALRDRLGA